MLVGMCQLFLGSVVLSLFSAFYFCTLFWLPRLRGRLPVNFVFVRLLL